MKVTDSRKAYRMFSKSIHPLVEEFWVMALSSDKGLLGCQMIFRGTVSRCLVHPREIFRYAILRLASGIIIAHNHPAGGTSPSPSDMEMTKRLVSVGDLLDIPVLDHLILGKRCYTSLRDADLIRFH